MAIKRYIGIWVLSLGWLFCSTTSAQIIKELQFITTNNPLLPIQQKQKLSSFNFRETSEIKIVFMGAIRLYQLFISSQQDKLVCIFTPSCSHFAMAAIKKYGVFYGILMASDRLQRCHTLGRKDYLIHPTTGKFYDPIEPYYLGIKCRHLPKKLYSD